MRNASLTAKLVGFTTLLAVVGVVAGFFVVTVLVRSHTQKLLAATLSHHQTTLTHLQREGLEGLVRTSSLLADSPTLRAALETYEDEDATDAATASELLTTIQTEADKIAFALDHDLLVVTDRRGRVLAASGPTKDTPRAGDDLSSQPVVERALEPMPARGDRDFALLTVGGEPYRVGAVPIVLRGFLIGTLTVGDRLDAPFVDRLARTFDCDFAILASGKVLGSTVPALHGPVSLPAPSVDGKPRLARWGSEDYVVATIPFGSDGAGAAVDLVLLHSLTRALGSSNRSLAWALFACGLVAVAVGGFAAWRMSRSVVQPLDRFLGFVRGVAAGDRSTRFARSTGCLEVDALSDTFDQLLESLLAHEKRLREAAREELDRLDRLKESEKLAALGRMLSGAAHEINNPLTGVIGNVELLLRSPALPDDVRERLSRIERDARRVSALVKNLLKISHRDTGARGPVDVHAVLQEAADVRRHDFATAGMTLALELCAGEVRVLGSELELEQVFLNVINNAYDALEGCASPTLTATTSAHEGRVTVCFEDNGPGLSQPAQVFDPFFTTKPVGQGTGLGLSICHSIVRGHGGEMTGENAVGAGARFTITLPAYAGPTRPAPAPRPRRADAALADLEALVLVVDDEPSIVELQKDLLETLGAAVESVTTGAEAIEILRERTFDLIVSDLKMPGGVSGEDLYRWVAEHRPEAAKKFLFVTGDVAGGAWSESEEIGARILAKPFSTDEYLRVVSDAIKSRRA